MTATHPTAGWRDDPDVLSWDWRHQPDMGELALLLARHGVRLTELDTGSDQFAIRITTDPTPQPATHASGPLAGQPVTPTPVEQLVEHIAHHRPPGRPVVDCQWCPEPEPERVPVVVLEDALCRRVWAGALRWAAPPGMVGNLPDHIRRWANQIEAGQLTPWAGQPEPPAAPAQPAQDDPRDYYPMHDHGYGRHSHHVAQKHAGDVANPRANDHSGLPRVTQQEAYQPAAGPTPGQADLASGGDAQSEPAVPLAPAPTGAAILGRALLGARVWRCPVAHPAHGQCELYQGHRPAGDPDRRHRTGALSWLTDAEIQACGLPPLASYAGTDLQSGPANASAESAATANLATASHGLATPAPESAGGPGWDRKTIVALAAGLAGEVLDAELISPERGRELRDQVLALLADLDLYVGALDTRSTQLYDALAERDAARAELEAAQRILGHGVRVEKMLEGERDAARAELAVVSADLVRFTKTALAWADEGCRFEVQRDQAQREVARLEEELVGVRSECDRLRDALTNSRAAASDRKADADKIAHDLITERNQAVRDVHAVNEALRAATAEQATAREEVDQTRLQAAEARTVADSYAEQLDAARAELARVAGSLANRDATLAARTAQLNAVREQLAEVTESEIRARAELATARRDAAADTLKWLGDGRAGVPLNSGAIRTLAAEVRAGTRPVPGSPEPDGGGDDG
jgi:hypothetical protein